MSAFDKVIGFDVMKQELMQICDMIHNRERYEALGATLPKGILIIGEPGTGKTLMSKCFIEESGLPVYTLRKTKDSFAEEITRTFELAAKNAPAIVFLDDMDKFANGDRLNRNASEYISIQSGIDSCVDCRVMVIGTVNEIYRLPESLTRKGRFDRKYIMDHPNPDDSEKVIRYYLENKNIDPQIDMKDVTHLFLNMTCAEIDVILNDAAIRAAYMGKKAICIEEIKEAYIRVYYDSPDFYCDTDKNRIRKIALHEAGHLVMCEVFSPRSVGIASICEKRVGIKGGFVVQSVPENDLIKVATIALAGKAATEMYYADQYSEGGSGDIASAYNALFSAIKKHGYVGLQSIGAKENSEVMIEHFVSDDYKSTVESQIHAELERCMSRAREILYQNRDIMLAYADALEKKHTLLYSDIQSLKSRNIGYEMTGKANFGVA